MCRDLRIHLEPEHSSLVEEDQDGEVSILVTWEDCDIAEYVVSDGPARVLEYTLEIQPQTEVGLGH